MKKYLNIIAISFKWHTVYIYDVLWVNLTYILRVLIIVFLYKAMYKLNSSASIWYSLDELCWSLIFVQALVTSKPRISDDVWQEIKTGQVTKYMLYPVSYVTYKFLENISRFLYSLIVSLVIWFILWFILLGSIKTSIPWFFAWLILVFGAMLINFFWYMLVWLSAFFFEDSEWVRIMYASLDRLFWWNILPIPMFPQALQSIIFKSPFAYAGYTAWLIFVRYDQARFIEFFSMQLLWSLLLYWSCVFVYRIALKKLTVNWG